LPSDRPCQGKRFETIHACSPIHGAFTPLISTVSQYCQTGCRYTTDFSAYCQGKSTGPRTTPWASVPRDFRYREKREKADEISRIGVLPTPKAGPLAIESGTQE